MEESLALSHSTPMRAETNDDSGYLTNTPKSTDSYPRNLSIITPSSSSEEKVFGSHQPLFTPGCGPGSKYRPLRLVSVNRPFPFSNEEAQDIDCMEELSSPEKRVDAMLCFGDSAINDVDIDMHETSMYAEKLSCEEMEVDLDHPNETWSHLDDKYNEDRLRERCGSISLQTGDGRKLLEQKLAALDQGGQIVQDSRENAYFSWRDQLLAKGHRFARDFSGKNTVDYLHYLSRGSAHCSITSRILGYLTPADLLNCESVSTTWKNICREDAAARKRLYQHKRYISNMKENVIKPAALNSNYPVRPLAQIENIGPVRTTSPNSSPPVSPSRIRFKRFFDATKLLKDNEYQKACPRCNSPSIVSHTTAVGECRRRDCLFQFCSKCNFVDHRPNHCSSILSGHSRKRVGSIGSKESKKNLRRL